MPESLLYAIVLSNNRLEDTQACLASLVKSDYSNLKMLHLENDSMNESMEAIRRDFPQVEILPLKENLGYAGNNNTGLHVAITRGAEWILLLNNDTVLDASCLSSMIEAGMHDPSVGIIGPMVYHYDEPDVIQSAGGMLDSNWHSTHIGMNETDHGQYPAVRQVDWVSGCAIMVRRDLVAQVGALDPDYFLYWEETEWCIRASRAGWKVIHVPHARLWHKGVKRNYEPGPYVTYYMTRNYLHTLSKYRAPIRVRAVALGTILKTLVSWSIKPQWRNKKEHRNAMWKGLINFLQRRWGPMPT